MCLGGCDNPKTETCELEPSDQEEEERVLEDGSVVTEITQTFKCNCQAKKK